jgi:isopentenyl phosphate kinase
MKVLGLSEPRVDVVLKIGGSVITDKKNELAARTQEINRIAQEIQRADLRDLIVVHGGGSFGHPYAQRYRLKEGLKEESQKIGFSETHHVMTVLNGLVMDALVWHGVQAVSITPSSCLVTEGGRIKDFADAPLRKYLNMGFLPVLYGDVVLDTKLGFTVLSGDQLISYLASKFHAKRIVVGVDVDGVYESDPKTDDSSPLMKELDLQDLRKLQVKFGKSTSSDVTGGMPGKLIELVPAVEQGIPVTVVNATKPNYVEKALKGDTVEGTIIKKG